MAWPGGKARRAQRILRMMKEEDLLSNGKMLNEEIVKAGYATIKAIPPNVKYKDRFLNAFKFAEETKRGLWNE
jgi:endonuclease YncB( thermonuclease family)